MGTGLPGGPQSRSILPGSKWWPATEFTINLEVLYLVVGTMHVRDTPCGGLRHHPITNSGQSGTPCLTESGQAAAITPLPITTAVHAIGATLDIKPYLSLSSST
ncbi:hypothetical protein SKAU_G00136390 [Synaphobranchus kaupii]|uniref:Uncharacterized protein n=1 Tax=Synaphobranchus kaupii TaxID=118154 RepID=A0A9Q1FSE8_SYNKA|nr:hypothetical protein SKAU_G00136390 [Synaphobranchus kaupii]